MSDPILGEVDDTIHAKARLGIMTILVTEGKADFRDLKARLDLTDGNLGAHLSALESAGYLAVHKTFVGRRPRTTYTPTREGIQAFHRYLDHMEALIRAVRSADPEGG